MEQPVLNLDSARFALPDMSPGVFASHTGTYEVSSPGWSERASRAEDSHFSTRSSTTARAALYHLSGGGNTSPFWPCQAYQKGTTSWARVVPLVRRAYTTEYGGENPHISRTIVVGRYAWTPEGVDRYSIYGLGRYAWVLKRYGR